MKVKTSELSGVALDWAVAYIEFNGEYRPIALPKYSTDWSQGGPIIEREISRLEDLGDEGWEAMGFGFVGYGYTPLIAAMRCYVASKRGDVVDIPNELVEVTK